MALNLNKASFPKITAKLAGIRKEPKLPKIKLNKVKSVSIKGPKDFNFTKMTKTAKLPNPKKVKALKSAVKKSTYGIKF